MPDPHAHLPRTRSGTVDVAFCKCGAERRNGRKKWQEPTTAQGIEMRAAFEALSKETNG